MAFSVHCGCGGDCLVRVQFELYSMYLMLTRRCLSSVDGIVWVWLWSLSCECVTDCTMRVRWLLYNVDVVLIV